MKRINMAVFVSGSGTNCENIIRYFSTSDRYHVALVVSNRPDAYALVRAEKLNVPTRVVNKAALNDSSVILPLMEQFDIHFIVLAGFLPLVPSSSMLSLVVSLTSTLPCCLNTEEKECGDTMYTKQ